MSSRPLRLPLLNSTADTAKFTQTAVRERLLHEQRLWCAETGTAPVRELAAAAASGDEHRALRREEAAIDKCLLQLIQVHPSLPLWRALLAICTRALTLTHDTLLASSGCLPC